MSYAPLVYRLLIALGLLAFSAAIWLWMLGYLPPIIPEVPRVLPLICGPILGILGLPAAIIIIAGLVGVGLILIFSILPDGDLSDGDL
ncbi:hypothetical protein [Thioalkalivibrio sp. K90mix]|uniref:hypothetical protein n=1 Tax=Thioalkalivibrio sp. (strain K90mix) TaxID=396595 RepID=UPI0003724191|nr:hypothetical protein [Thioalkalivibrio sp. K90mix]